MILAVALGMLQFHESYSEDYFGTPSCSKGIFASDHVQCSTGDLPPCQKPSFEKNGYCVVKKMDICEKDTVLKDGDCLPDTSVGYHAIERQHLQTGEIISRSGTFASMMIGSLGPILIAFFIILYAVKRGRAKRKENQTEK